MIYFQNAKNLKALPLIWTILVFTLKTFVVGFILLVLTGVWVLCYAQTAGEIQLRQQIWQQQMMNSQRINRYNERIIQQTDRYNEKLRQQIGRDLNADRRLSNEVSNIRHMPSAWLNH